jgi:hypothetical protein
MTILFDHFPQGRAKGEDFHEKFKKVVDDCEGFNQEQLLVQTMGQLGIDCEIGNEEEEEAAKAALSIKNTFPIFMAVGIGGVLVTACADCLPQSDA